MMEGRDMTNRLYRSRKDRLIGGVCGGLGVYFGIDPVIFRLLFVVAAIWGGVGVLTYLIMWIVIPAEERMGAASQEVIQSNVSEIESEARKLAQEARGVFSGTGEAPSKERTMWAAVALILIGVVLLSGNLLNVDLGQLWPLALILVGGFLLYQALQRR
jgi:phage shock protein PspC (stress-responsive transcriptional regulator)